MYKILEDGRLQVTAAAGLLENSRLVEWSSAAAEFRPVMREAFEFSCRHDVDPVFGRLICWITFSAGAEFLLKGICLIKEIEIRSEDDVPSYPTGEIDKWLPSFRKDWKSHGIMKATNFGTIGKLIYEKSENGNFSPLTRLCNKVNATIDQKDLVFSTYTLLGKTIRNRDAHAYVPNVRDSHHPLVPELFSKCFNLLVSWLPDGSETLNKWRAEASSFVESL